MQNLVQNDALGFLLAFFASHAQGMSQSTPELFKPTRAAGLARVKQFASAMGQAYASTRNVDFGPENRENISCLSGHVRHRLVLERELAHAALSAHGPRASEKFLQEVFWRTYWKGWLEMRPRVWQVYKVQRDADRAALAKDGDLNQRYTSAVEGETGLACMDAWARELKGAGYLHNHARMWFASIWIFTFKLPWALGADYFLRHLIDGDAASNTLSWRWVAGLQTQGKTYLARPSNIESFTNGRFDPSGDALASDAEPLVWVDPPAPKMPDVHDVLPTEPYTLVLHEEDCAPETLPLACAPQRLVVQNAPCSRGPEGLGDMAAAFTQGALDDLCDRAGAHFSMPVERLSLKEIAKLNGPCVMPYVPVGPVRDTLGQYAIQQIAREEDKTLWPYATKGFFKFKKALPDAIQQLGLGIA